MTGEAMTVATLWASVTNAELEAIADAGWRSWPDDVAPRISRTHGEAVALARSFAREQGGGNVVRFDVDGDVLVGLPPDGLRSQARSLVAALTSAITTEAEYRGDVGEIEIARAESAMKLRFPPPWRSYLRRPSWFYRGWMANGAFVWINTPAESMALVGAWSDFADRLGMIPIGGDGAGEMITVDARDPRSGVTLTPHVSIGWENSVLQCGAMDEFIDALEAGTFEFKFE